MLQNSSSYCAKMKCSPNLSCFALYYAQHCGAKSNFDLRVRSIVADSVKLEFLNFRQAVKVNIDQPSKAENGANWHKAWCKVQG